MSERPDATKTVSRYGPRQTQTIESKLTGTLFFVSFMFIGCFIRLAQGPRMKTRKRRYKDDLQHLDL